MIGYLEGTIIHRASDHILLLAGEVGYEVMLPAVVMAALREVRGGEKVALYIYHHQTDRQPKPVLIGFRDLKEKAFFQKFISVADVGPLKAVKALSMPMEDVATAIEQLDVAKLIQLKGVGRRTAQKLVAALAGKMEAFASSSLPSGDVDPAVQGFIGVVYDTLSGQLGHKPAEAKQLIREALARKPDIQSAEALVDEIYRRVSKS
jgi:Holliday junction DNA helicase RuvA